MEMLVAENMARSSLRAERVSWHEWKESCIQNHLVVALLQRQLHCTLPHSFRYLPAFLFTAFSHMFAIRSAFHSSCRLAQFDTLSSCLFVPHLLRCTWGMFATVRAVAATDASRRFLKLLMSRKYLWDVQILCTSWQRALCVAGTNTTTTTTSNATCQQRADGQLWLRGWVWVWVWVWNCGYRLPANSKYYDGSKQLKVACRRFLDLPLRSCSYIAYYITRVIHSLKVN